MSLFPNKNLTPDPGLRALPGQLGLFLAAQALASLRWGRGAGAAGTWEVCEAAGPLGGPGVDEQRRGPRWGRMSGDLN